MLSMSKKLLKNLAQREDAFAESVKGFDKVLIQDASRHYGVEHKSPKMAYDAMLDQKATGVAELAREIKMAGRFLTHIHSTSSKGNSVLLNRMKPHCKEFYGDIQPKNFYYLLKTAALKGIDKKTNAEMLDRVLNGLSTCGNIRKSISSNYQSVVAEEISSEELEEFLKKDVKLQGSHWANAIQRESMKAKADEYISKRLWTELPGHPGGYCCVCFPVVKSSHKRRMQSAFQKIVDALECSWEEVVAPSTWKAIKRRLAKDEDMIELKVTMEKLDRVEFNEGDNFKNLLDKSFDALPIRLCSDFRKLNSKSRVKDKMTLWGLGSHLELIQLAASPTPNIVTNFQTKRDVKADLEYEQHLKKCFEADAEVFLEKNYAQVGEILKPDTSEWDEEDKELLTDDADDKYAFLVFMICIDFSGYYMQFAVDNKAANVMCVPNVLADESAAGAAEQKEYRFFESASTQFGSLAAVFEAVSCSEYLMHRWHKIVRALPLTIYIDDSTLFVRPQIALAAKALFELDCAFSNVTISDKTQMHGYADKGKTIQKALTSLGLGFEVSRDHSMKIFMPQSAIDAADDRARYVVNALENKQHVTLKSIEELRGSFRYAALLCPAVRACARVLDDIARLDVFWQQVKTEAGRLQMLMTMKMLRSQLKKLKPKIVKAGKRGNLVHMYSDASCEPDENDPKKGNVFMIGGCMIRPDLPPVAFSIKIDEFPAWFLEICDGNPTIAAAESLAVHISEILFDDFLDDDDMQLQHCDNQASTYSINKGQCRSFSEHVIVQGIHETRRRDTFLAWISTVRNIFADSLTRLSKLKKVLEYYEPICGKFKMLEVDQTVIPWNSYEAIFREFEQCLPVKQLLKMRRDKREAKKEKKKRKILQEHPSPNGIQFQ